MKPMDTSHVYKAALVAAIALTAIVSAQVQAQQKVLTERAGMRVDMSDKQDCGASLAPIRERRLG